MISEALEAFLLKRFAEVYQAGQLRKPQGQVVDHAVIVTRAQIGEEIRRVVAERGEGR